MTDDARPVAEGDAADPARWARHTSYTDPGRHRDLLAAVPPELMALTRAATNLIIHYRASGLDLSEESRQDINARWLRVILDLDQQRHPAPLQADRDPLTRVQGCCRDHCLLAAGVLREHGRPARIRYGFSRYFDPAFAHDHVIVETWQPDRRRWLRFDPELADPLPLLPTPQDIPAGPGAPFVTAAEAWQGYRGGRLDPDGYGVDSSLPLRGPWFLQGAVMLDAAFRAGIEVLLWDGWTAMSAPDGPTTEEVAVTDGVAALIVAADAGDRDAERQLLTRVVQDRRVGPGDRITSRSPYGDPPVQVDLAVGPLSTTP